jgi:hypothetical protein
MMMLMNSVEPSNTLSRQMIEPLMGLTKLKLSMDRLRPREFVLDSMVESMRAEY